MTRRRLCLFVALAAFLLTATTLLAQEPASEQVPPLAVTVPQAAPIKPPSPTATAAELETQADELRVQKAWLDAIDYYKAALKRKPADPAVLYNKMGISQLQLQRIGDAKKSFEHSIKADRQYAEAYNNLGVVFYWQKKYSKAEKNYKQALTLREDSASFHSNLGTSLFARKLFEAAMVEYVRAVELDPLVFERRSQAGVAARMSSPEDRARYSFMLARMYARVGDMDHALNYLRKAMEDGYKEIADVYKEAEFAELRKDPRFTELMASKPVAIPQ